MEPPQPGPPRFDPSLQSWILSSYTDVSSALRDSRLSAGGAQNVDEAAHLAVREAALRDLSADRLAQWREHLEHSARETVSKLPAGRTTDLAAGFAKPWSLTLAMLVAGAPHADRDRLSRLAGDLFRAAAHATSSTLPSEALAVAAELARSIPSSGPSAGVQSFLALSQTLPCFLAAAWLELLRHPAALSRLRSEPDLLPHAIEELLRYAGPSRAVFRQAASSVQIGDANIGTGQCVVLMLASANRDPAQFPNPDRLDFHRGGAGHVGFGGGAHSCSGAALIRMAATVATAALLERLAAIEPAGEPEWLGGFAIRGPASLPVIVRHRGDLSISSFQV